MLADAIRALLSEGESETVEFKTAIPPAPILAKTLAALANTRGGVLLLGVDDRESPRVVGVDADRAEVVVQHAAAMLQPIPELQTSRVFVDDVEVFAVQVGATRKLTLAPDGLFIRSGDRERAFTPSEAVSRLSSGETDEASEAAAALAQAVAGLTAQSPLCSWQVGSPAGGHCICLSVVGSLRLNDGLRPESLLMACRRIRSSSDQGTRSCRTSAGALPMVSSAVRHSVSGKVVYVDGVILPWT